LLSNLSFSPRLTALLRHNHKLQVLNGIRPHSTVPPTTTSASSSDLHPRIYAKFLDLLFLVWLSSLRVRQPHSSGQSITVMIGRV
jgi:hypothetical protein